MKKIGEFLLENRFTRLLATLLFFAVLGVPLFAIGIRAINQDWNLPDDLMHMTPLFHFLVCFVAQFLGDLMNVDSIFNNAFVTFLKRVIFFGVSLGAILFGVGMVVATGALSHIVNENGSVFWIGMCIAKLYAPTFAFAAYVFEYISLSNHGHRASRKKRLPFIYPITLVGSFLISFILALIFKLAGAGGGVITTVLPLLVLVPIGISIFACFKTGTWPFEEGYYSVGGYSGSTGNRGSSGGTGGTNGPVNQSLPEDRGCEKLRAALRNMYGTSGSHSSDGWGISFSYKATLSTCTQGRVVWSISCSVTSRKSDPSDPNNWLRKKNQDDWMRSEKESIRSFIRSQTESQIRDLSSRYRTYGGSWSVDVRI